MTIYNRIKTKKRKKLFLLFLRFLKDYHLISKIYNVETIRELNIPRLAIFLTPLV